MSTIRIVEGSNNTFFVEGNGLNNETIVTKLKQLGGQFIERNNDRYFLFNREKLDPVQLFLDSLTVSFQELCYKVEVPKIDKSVLVNGKTYRIEQILAKDVITLRGDKMVKAAVIAGRWRTIPDFFDIKFL